jgi:hypothetical protein
MNAEKIFCYGVVEINSFAIVFLHLEKNFIVEEVMSLNNRSFILLIILMAMALACTAPVLSATPSVAPTMPVSLETDTRAPLSDTSAPLATETPSPIPTASVELPTLTPADTATPISFPKVVFLRNTNCRVGPLKNYFLQTSFIEGRNSTAEGRNQDSSWLLVKSFEGQNCWISVSNVKDPANYAYLPIVDFPPLPEAPFQMVVVTRDCVGRNRIVLHWPDVSGETGYRIYRGGIMLASLKMNAIEYRDYPPDSNSYSYEVESINTYGVSVRLSMSVAGCRPQ